MGSRPHGSGDAGRLGAALVVLIAVFCATANAIEEPKFEALRRAAKAMEAATATVVSYERFSELARELATELVTAETNVADDEDRALVMLYAQAGLAYGDALALWREKEQAQGSSWIASTAPSIEPLIARYRIRSDGDRIDADSAIRSIWGTAEKALRKAELLHEGRADELVAIFDAEDRTRAAEEAEEAARQRAMMERVAEEFDEAERRVKRPKPYEASEGNWTCPRGYVVRRGECLADDEVARLPKVEMGL